MHNTRVVVSNGAEDYDYAPSPADGLDPNLDALRAMFGRPTSIGLDSSAVPAISLCDAVGPRILTDLAADVTVLEGLTPAGIVPSEAQDLRYMHIAHPYVESGDQELVIRLGITSTDGFLPGSSYFVSFVTNAGFRGVRMQLVDPAAPEFFWYVPGANNAGGVDGRFVDAQTPITGEVDDQLNEIRFFVNPAVFGLDAGSEDAALHKIRDFNAGVVQSSDPINAGLPGIATITDSMPNGSGRIGEAEVLTNEACNPDAMNTAPVATAQSVTTEFEAAIEITLAGTDADGDNLSFAIVAAPANGTLGAVNGNKVSYTPNDGYSGSDAFTFKANDGTADSAPATVSITVNAAEDVDTDGDGILDKDEKDGCINDPDPACGETTGGGDNGTLDAELAVTAGADNFTFVFDASASHYEEGGTLNQPMYRFAFGDGETTPPQSAATISHSYDAAGTYRAFVVVSDANGNSAISEEQLVEVIITIEVTDGGENAARMTVDRATGAAPLRVTFDATGSTTAEGFSISNYAWDFDGDGTVDLSGSNGVVQHVYTAAGNYQPQVTVTFTDDADAQNTETSVAKASVAATNNATPVSDTKQAGGGALGTLLLLPLLGFAALRRKRLH